MIEIQVDYTNDGAHCAICNKPVNTDKRVTLFARASAGEWVDWYSPDGEDFDEWWQQQKETK